MDICPISWLVSRRLDLRNLTLIAAAMLMAGGAVADTAGYSATLAQPQTAKKEFIIHGNLFRCDGSTCILVSRPTNDSGDLTTCRALQREVGTLTSYVANGKPFDSDRLAKCNSHG
jgi:hypothetical protein